MNLPTRLTLIRILLTFAVMGLLFMAGWIAKAAALVLFLLASLTDWLDGYLARRWNQRSALGALLDPIAGKVLILGTLLAFVQLRLVPAWMELIIILRELLITGVRLFAASRHVILAAAKEGKHKTVSQVIAVIAILVLVLVRELRVPSGIESALESVVLGCLWLTVILTVVSGSSFFRRHKTVLRDAVYKPSG